MSSYTEQLVLTKLETTNLQNCITLLEKQLSEANRALACASSSAEVKHEFDVDNMTKNEKMAALVGMRRACAKIRRVWKMSRKIEHEHPDWTFDLRRGKMYIFFGSTDLYGDVTMNTYGVRLTCLGDTFAVKPVFGHLTTIKMEKYEYIKKDEVGHHINMAVAAWNEQLTSEDMTVQVEKRCVNLVGQHNIILAAMWWPPRFTHTPAKYPEEL